VIAFKIEGNIRLSQTKSSRSIFLSKRCAMKRRHTAAPSRIMTATDLAQYLRVHRATIHKLLRKGQIPAFKVGADYRFDRDIIDKWIAEQQIKVP
jgi:excisionase family DNA binding protein